MREIPRSSTWRRPRNVIVALVVSGALAVLVASLTGGEAQAAGRFPDLQVSRRAASEQAAVARQRATGEAGSALADGKVTTAEYLAAVQRTTDCLAKGATSIGPGSPVTVAPSEPELSPDEFEYSYFYSTAGPGANDRAVITALGRLERDCQARHLIDVQWTYQLALRSDPAYIERIGQSFETCAKANGVDVDVHGKNAIDVYFQLREPKVADQHPNAHRCAADLPSVMTDLSTDPMELTKP